MALKYNDKSVAEQNSVDLAWNILMEDRFEELRGLIYTNEDEFRRFRQIIVNIVLGKFVPHALLPSFCSFLDD